MLQQDKPDDYLLATNETHTVREFVEKTAQYLDIDLIWKGKGINEKGLDKKRTKLSLKLIPNISVRTEVDILMGDYSKPKNNLAGNQK